MYLREARSSRSAKSALLTAALLALLAGCGRDAGRFVSAGGDTSRLAAANASATKRAKAGPFDEQANARNDLAVALARAKEDGRFVLIEFGANWCPDCIVLARLFEDGVVKPFLTANFHLVKVNVGRNDQNQDLCAEYGQPTAKGIPAVVVLDPDGRVLASTNGGELANARTATAQEILGHLKRWRTAKTGP